MSRPKQFSRISFVHRLEECGISHEEAMDMMREIFGRAEYRQLERQYAEQGTAHAKAMASRREKTVESSWRALLKPLNAKIRALRFHGPKRPTVDEQVFYDQTRQVLEKAEAHIHLLRRKAEALTDKCLSPAVVARQNELPNSGLYWVDWVPPAVRRAVEAEEARIHAARKHGAKAPGIFKVAPNERDLALRARHFVTLNTRIEALKAQIKALPPGVDPQRAIHMNAEMRVYQRALAVLDSWPVYKAVPVDPVKMLGTSITAVEREVENASSEIAATTDVSDEDGIDPTTLERLVEEAIERAQSKAGAAKAAAARRAAGIRKVRKDKKPEDDE